MKTRLVLALSVVTAFSVAVIYFILEHANMYRLSVQLTTLEQLPARASEPFPNTAPSSVGTSVTPPRTSHSGRTFVVVETYTNQLSAALVGYLQLAQVTDSLNMGVVEPFVFHSQLFGIPNQPTNVSVPHLGDYFNLTALQNLLHQCSVLHSPSRHIFTFRDFLVQSSRNLVTINLRRGDHPNEAHLCHNTTHATNIERRLNTHVNAVREQAMKLHGKEYNFTIIESLCIAYDSRSPLSVKKELMKGLALVRHAPIPRPTLKTTTTSLILTGKWGLVAPVPALYSIYDPSITLQNYNCNITLLPHTNLVTSFALEFFRSLSVPRPVIAVHLRFEQLFKSAFKVFKSTIAYLNRCLINVRHLLEQLVGPGSKRRTQNRGIFVRDMKQYGSRSVKVHPDVMKRGRFAVYLLEYFGLKEVQFDPTDPQFSGAPTEQTFVALVEQEALTMVDTLVLIGGGRYQQHMADRFLQTHLRQDIHFLCARNVTVTVL